MKYRKKPVVIDAIKWDGKNKEELSEFVDFDKYYFAPDDEGERLCIITLEGTHHANVGDWIIKGVKGEFYPIKPDIFEMTYEKV